MEITGIDHLVITTNSLDDCVRFYVDVLGMRHEESDGRHILRFGRHKINLHVRKKEFQPAATHPEPGSLDFCLLVATDIRDVKAEIENRGGHIIEGPVIRNGAQGTLLSIYLYDPDGNLVELAQPIDITQIKNGIKA